jgi:hypothetical protein
MAHRLLQLAPIFFTVLVPAAFSQATPETLPPPPVAAVAATPPPSAWTKHGIDIYVLGDVYGDINFNHPSNGYNNLYNFDDKANQLHLSFAKVSLEKASGMFGFRVDAGTGRTVDIISGGDDGPSGMKYLEQAFLEFRPKNAHGIQLDFGKFVTSAGAEVIESNSNWNYSRSLLFAWAIPYYHFGVRATIPVNKTFSAGVQLVNGWNSVGDNNSLETVGLVGIVTTKKVVFTNTFYTGPQKEGLVTAYRNLIDSVVVITPNDKSTYYLNFDYGNDKQTGGVRQKWAGVAAAGRFQLTKLFALAPRAEVYTDFDGFNTGVPQTVKEVTVTGEMKLHEGLLARLEYRHDNSDKPYFDRGAGTMVINNQSTVTLGLIAFFGPKK